MAVGKNKTWKKGYGASNIIFPMIFRLLGRISSEEKGRGRKSRGKKNGVGNLIHPLSTRWRINMQRYSASQRNWPMQTKLSKH